MTQRKADGTGLLWCDEALPGRSAVLLDQLIDGVAKLGREGIRLSEVVAAGLDGWPEDEFERRAIG